MNIAASYTTYRRLLSDRKLLLLCVLASLLAVASSATILFFRSVRAEGNPSVKKTEPSRTLRTSKTTCCGQNPEDENKPHLLAASYYSVQNHLTATLMLNNKGPKPIEVKPTLFSLIGERLDVAPVTVEGNSFRNIDLRDFGAIPGTSFQEGSLQLFHRGPDLVIGAQLYLVDGKRSLSFDEKLVEFATAPSTQLESVWWLPSHRCNVQLILSNTSDSALTASTAINADTAHPEPKEFTLAAHETKVVRVQREQPSSVSRISDNIGSASIWHSGPKGSLVARALIEDQAKGYSWSAQFYYPQGGKSSGYQGVGLRLGTAGGERLTPVVVARNVGDAPTVLTGRLPYTLHDGGTGVVQLPKVRLAPGEADSVDVERAIRTKGIAQSIATASLEFEYTSTPGSVMMAAQSVSASGNQVFRVPMWDVPAQRNGTGGYPWFIDGSSSTLVYIKNVTDKKQQYTFDLTFDGGVYATGVKSVEPRQTVALDLRSIRDNQIPDERGRTIPLNATRGKVVWSVRGPEPLALLGRSEQADLVKGISSSYACFMCCPNSFYNSWLGPNTLNVQVGSSIIAASFEQDRNCYGQPLTPYYYSGTWSSDNTSVATMSSGGAWYEGVATAQSQGYANVFNEWDVYDYTLTTENGHPECRVFSYVASPTAALNSGIWVKDAYEILSETFVGGDYGYGVCDYSPTCIGTCTDVNYGSSKAYPGNCPGRYIQCEILKVLGDCVESSRVCSAQNEEGECN